MGYKNSYPFIRYAENYLEWENKNALKNIFERLKNTKTRKFKVLHIGDSHIQADIFTGMIRDNLQQIFGYGGRGFIFPYASAKTHSANDYRTFTKGNWESTRNVLKANPFDMGITGATIFTKDTATGFGFKFYRNNHWDAQNKIRIYTKMSNAAYNLQMKVSGYDSLFTLKFDSTNTLPYVAATLPMIPETLEFSLKKTDSLQQFFECYGLLIEAPENKGILYNSVGINGAGLTSVLKQKLFEQQLAELQPDLVIIDIGGNDYAGGKININEIKLNLEKFIASIKNASPEAAILISCTQDFYRRRRNIGAAKDFSELTREVAFKNNCIHYNYYNIAGGKYAMLKWQKNKLCQRDRIHLTGSGYSLKGELYTQAFLNTYRMFLEEGLPASFLVDSLQTVAADTASNTLSLNTDSLDSGMRKIIYFAEKYERVGTIARKYGVTAADLKKWNKLTGNMVDEGEQLIIYQKINKVKSPNWNAKPHEQNLKKQTSSKEKNQTANTQHYIYVVKSGDSLYTIAQKFKTTVKKLKTLNSLRSDKLKPGQKLKIK